MFTANIQKKKILNSLSMCSQLKGYNIRNYVAHAFYIPQDYGMIEATLVFLCILRLTMFSPKSKTITANMRILPLLL